MEDVLKKPLKELSDAEVMDLLELVSDEVQRRNRLNGAGAVHDVVSQALETFVSGVKLLEPKAEK